MTPTLSRFNLSAARDCTTRTLADLHEAARRGAAHLPETVPTNGDRVLYTAFRDIQPARPGPGDSAVYADLVVYEGGLLSGGQPVRSIGHWNTDRQIEVFQVLAGTVLMAWTNGLGPAITYRWCGPGDLVSIPPGAWHITYAPQPGPSTVFNIYTDLPAHPGPHDERSCRDAALAPGRLKYTADRPPVALRATGTFQPALISDSDVWGPVTASATGPLWARHLIGDDLPTWHMGATHADVTRLHRTAPRA